MNVEMKNRWVNALRSGVYHQGKNYLCQDNKYCCLGVLCEVLEIKSEISLDYPGEQVKSYLFDGWKSQCVIPQDLGMKIGLIGTESNKLISMNDGGAPFSKIADYIEENL